MSHFSPPSTVHRHIRFLFGPLPVCFDYCKVEVINKIIANFRCNIRRWCAGYIQPLQSHNKHIVQINIAIRLKLTGVSVQVPPDTYTTTVQYTVVEI